MGEDILTKRMEKKKKSLGVVVGGCRNKMRKVSNLENEVIVLVNKRTWEFKESVEREEK